MKTFITAVLIVLSAVSVQAVQKLPEVVHVGLISPTLIGITIQAGYALYGKQIPYIKEEGDKIGDEKHHRWVIRNGKIIGSLVGKDGKTMYTVDQVAGSELNTSLASQNSNWSITSKDDPNYRNTVHPVEIFRKSKASDLARKNWEWNAPVKHIIYLKLSKPLTIGRQYEISALHLGFPKQKITFEPTQLRSEAVHVSHIGFRPDDPSKIAFLSCWLGSGGAHPYQAGMPFKIIDIKTGNAVFEGKTVLSKAKDDKTEDAYKQNYNGTDVFLMDFSSLNKPGNYVVSVDGIGCSYPFEIADDVWKKAFTTSAHGFYHQRSGIELGPPYTSFKRPRTFHPDDGVKIYHTNVPLMDTGNGLNRKDSNFGNIVKNSTNIEVKNAWGGYMDAGDWDRRIQHLDATRLLLELAAAAPDFFEKVNLNIPESKNQLPDIVDEALFNLDCYRRMQTPEGGIRGGIESEEHPRHGEASWQESLTIYAYAPGVWSSYVYAGVAARAAGVLEKYDKKLAEEYQQSALKAMDWAEKRYPSYQKEKHDKKSYHAVEDSRNLAAAELFKLTGDNKWNDIFLETTAFKKPNIDLFVWEDHDQRDAAWVYARTERPGMDETIKKNCLAATIKEADQRMEEGKQSGFRWTKFKWQPAQWGAFSTPDGISLARAHQATGDKKYLETLVNACQTGAGANPLNTAYTTGIGKSSVQHPLHIDSRITHQPAPPGLTVGGPVRVDKDKDYWAQKIVSKWCYPSVDKWPTIEAFWDVFWYPPMCEFTVHDPMAKNAYVWGYLACRKKLDRN